MPYPLLNVCSSAAAMLTRSEILKRTPGNLKVSTVAVASSNQSDPDKNAPHPAASVELWESCRDEVIQHIKGLPPTDAVFPTPTLMDSKVIAW